MASAAKCADQLCAESRLRDRVRRDLLHRAHLRHGLIFIHARDGGLDTRSQRQGIACRAHGDRSRVPRILRDGDVNLYNVFGLTETRHFDLMDNTYNLTVHRLGSGGVHGLYAHLHPDRLPALHITAHKFFVDYANRRGGSGVMPVKCTTAKQLDSKRIEVRGSYNLIVGRRLIGLAIGRITHNFEPLADIPSVERQIAAERD